MRRRALERRRFLQAVGATALTLPFLRSVPSVAQAATPPKYLVLVFTPCGVVRYLWGAMGPARGSTAVASPLTGKTGAGAFRATLMPFATGPTLSNLQGPTFQDLTNQVVLLDGLNVATADGSHEAGMAALWTGILNNGGGSVGGKGMSIDQRVAQSLGAGRPIASLPLMVRDAGDFTERSVKTRMTYDATDFIDPYDDPLAARAAVFGQSPTTDGGAPTEDKQTAIRQAVFNQLNTELSALQVRMCTEDRQRLASVQAAWNGLDQQFAAIKAAVAACPDRPAALPATIDFPTAAKAQMDLAAFTMHCDLARVVTLQFSTATSNVTHKWIDPTDSGTHHVHSHTGPSSLYSLGTNLYDTSTYNPPGVPGYDPHLSQIDLFYANQVSYLAQVISGFGLLGQSLVCWGSELDQGQPHNHDATPFVLVGGAGGKIKTGQLVQFPLNLPGNTTAANNRFHNDLLVTIAQAMGVDISSFGTTNGAPSRYGGTPITFSTGPITEILKA